MFQRRGTESIRFPGKSRLWKMGKVKDWQSLRKRWIEILRIDLWPHIFAQILEKIGKLAFWNWITSMHICYCQIIGKYLQIGWRNLVTSLNILLPNFLQTLGNWELATSMRMLLPKYLQTFQNWELATSMRMLLPEQIWWNCICSSSIFNWHPPF